ncbi:MAG TPA: serine/threonine-protein kinase [Kofleriaceae bacterium]
MIRAPWSSGSSEEESRAYLQTRLTVLYKLMFWCFVVLIGFLLAVYNLHEDLEPGLQPWIYAVFGTGLGVMAYIWRGKLLRKQLSFETLNRIDTFYAVSAAIAIGICAVLSYDKRQAAYTCAIYSCFSVLTRALVVPSTGRRTAIVTTLASIPMAVAAVILPFINEWPPGKDVSGPALVVGFLQIEVVAILLAAAGSEIIYGLRQKVTAAQQLGQYTLGRKIGSGGMGVVYLAHHDLLRRPTAIKLLHPDRVGHDNMQRFEREVRHMSQLTHPNTVAVFDYGRSFEGTFYYAMEYLDGIDLHNLITKHGKQPAERVRQIMIQVCGALHEAHVRGISHRDIKPANIILCERGAMPDVAKVVDFGLAKELAKESGASTQVVVGTPAFVAPEAVTDPNSVGPAADLYALGCVGYFLLTGKKLFTGNTAVDICIQHVTKPPTPPSQVTDATVPRALEDIIMMCLAKQPSGRPASANDLADQLRAAGPFTDWDESRALAWWREFKPQDIADTTAQSTATITVDVGDRIGDKAA